MTNQKPGDLEKKAGEEFMIMHRTADGKYLVRTFPKPIEVYEFPKPRPAEKVKKAEYSRGAICAVAFYFTVLGLEAGVCGGAVLYNQTKDSKLEKPLKASAELSGNVGAKLNPGSAKVVCHPRAEKVYPPLNDEEGSELDALVGNRKAVQQFINSQIKYRADEAQFEGSLCKKGLDENGKKKRCDIWVPAAYFYQKKKGDCEDAAVFAHYLLRDGVGLMLSSDDKSKEDVHMVYVREEKGNYSIVSIAEHEQTEAKFQSIDEAANFLRHMQDYYFTVIFPDNPEKLLYDFNLKRDVVFGPKIDFPPKAEDKGKNEK